MKNKFLLSMFVSLALLSIPYVTLRAYDEEIEENFDNGDSVMELEYDGSEDDMDEMEMPEDVVMFEEDDLDDQDDEDISEDM